MPFTSKLQLADAKEVMEAIQTVEGARFPVLTPNLKVSYILLVNLQLWYEDQFVWAILLILLMFCSRALKQLLQLELRKWRSLLLLLSHFQNQISIVALKIVSFVIVMLLLLQENSQSLFVGMHFTDRQVYNKFYSYILYKIN